MKNWKQFILNKRIETYNMFRKIDYEEIKSLWWI